jgi:hypothetical protein
VAIFWVPMTLVAQAAASAGRAMLAAGPLVYLVWAPLEAVLLATWGFTPGKWLLRVSVRDARGDRLDPRAALRRAVVVWTFGLAMSQTIGLVTGLLARRRLRRDGATYWDTLDGHRVTHGRIGPLRATIAVSIVALLVAAMVAAAAGTP